MHCCDDCQHHTNIQLESTIKQTYDKGTIVPFTWRDLDIVSLCPQTNLSHKYLLVVVDYFTKWTKAKEVNSIKDQKEIR